MDNQDSPAPLDPLENQDNPLTRMNVMSRKETRDHPDLQGYGEKRDRKGTKETPVSSVRVPAPRE